MSPRPWRQYKSVPRAKAIGRRLGRSHNTVIKYLKSEVYTDPGIREIIKKIREKEAEVSYPGTIRAVFNR